MRSLEPSDYQAYYETMAGQLPKQHQYDCGHANLEGLDADWFADACKPHRDSALGDDCYNWIVFHKQTHQHLSTTALLNDWRVMRPLLIYTATTD